MKQEFRKNDNKRNFRKNSNKNFKNEKQLEENEYDDIVEGRNAVLELLDSDRDINKIFVQCGERHGSINKIIAIEGSDDNIFESDGKVKKETLTTLYKKYGTTCE